MLRPGCLALTTQFDHVDPAMKIVNGKWQSSKFSENTLDLDDDEIIFVIAIGPARDQIVIGSTELYVSYVITRETVGWTSLYQHEEIT